MDQSTDEFNCEMVQLHVWHSIHSYIKNVTVDITALIQCISILFHAFTCDCMFRILDEEKSYSLSGTCRRNNVMYIRYTLYVGTTMMY